MGNQVTLSCLVNVVVVTVIQVIWVILVVVGRGFK